MLYLQVDAEKLKWHVDQIASVLSLPWFLNSKFEKFRGKVSGLLDSMKAYHDFLVQQQTRTALVHSSTEPVRSFMDSSFINIKSCYGPVTPDYCLLYNALLDVAEYEPINTIDFEPEDRFDRRRWFEKLTLNRLLFKSGFINYWILGSG